LTAKISPEGTIRIENGATATFDCVFPKCGGICCKQGRPPVEPGEIKRIEANLEKFVPHLREKARKVVLTKGFMTKRMKHGLPMMAVSEGWCVFENQGCVLHKVGATEGDRFKYKPWVCATFPLDRISKREWYVRQWKLHGEAWDLFCLNPKESKKPATKTMAGEIEFAERLESGEEGWRGGSIPRAKKATKPAKAKASAKKRK
jgi:hypothetical protein